MPITAIVEQPFEQEITSFFNRHHGLESDWVPDVAVTADGTVWAANRFGVARFDGQRWEVLRDAKGLGGGDTERLAADPDGSLWFGCSTGVGRYREGRWERWYGKDAPTRHIRGLAPDGKGGVWVAMSHDGDLNQRGVWHFDGSRWENWEVRPDDRRGPLSVALDGQGRPYVVIGEECLRLDGDKWVTVAIGRGRPLAVASGPDGTIWVGTSEGVEVVKDGQRVRTIGLGEGMPVAAVRDVAFAPNGDTWLSHGTAASRLRGSEWRYYSPHTWFPGGALNGIAVAPNGEVWLAADSGISRIRTEMMTLAQKSALLEPVIPSTHLRHGYVLTRRYIEADNLESDSHWYLSDNDGLHTARFCYPECFRYAVTKTPAAKANAKETCEALLRLVTITGKRGMFARGAFRKDDPKIVGCSGEWNESADGEWLWKGDTSSDELDAHMFTYGLYYDLVADEEERVRIRSVISDLMGGVVENGYVLEDLDGKHTRWGVWAPELLWSHHWQAQRRLNTFEMLSYLRTAHHITGEERFNEAYMDLAYNHRYAEVVRTNQQATPPEGPSKFDDGLAFHTYYPILKYETDPDLRTIYLDSLARFYDFVRPERTPLYAAMVNIFLERNEDLDVIYEVLCGYRLGCASRRVINSIRQDVTWQTRRGRRMLAKVLPGAERAHYSWNDNPFEADSGGSPEVVSAPTSFLIAYWMARYHGLIVPA